jgi:hypothetical protein
VTFADSVLHLVRAGARIDTAPDSDVRQHARTDVAAEAVALAPETSEAPQLDDVELALGSAPLDQGDQPGPAVSEYEPGLADLEAAVGLVSAGLATRVVLSGFPSWPGLLWRAYQLADASGLLIIPTVVRPGGKVDIVITRDIAAHG